MKRFTGVTKRTCHITYNTKCDLGNSDDATQTGKWGNGSLGHKQVCFICFSLEKTRWLDNSTNRHMRCYKIPGKQNETRGIQSKKNMANNKNVGSKGLRERKWPGNNAITINKCLKQTNDTRKTKCIKKKKGTFTTIYPKHQPCLLEVIFLYK